MLAFLRDAIWQSIGAVLALIALFASIWFFLRQRSIKVLAYDVKEATSLVRIHQMIKGQKLKITLGDQEVSDAYMSTIIFQNRGNTPISRTDYDESLLVEFTESGQILSCDIVDKNPPELNIEWDIRDNKLDFEPFLLNTNESFTVKAIVINGQIRVLPSARIIGGNLKSFNDIDDTVPRRFLKTLLENSLTVFVISLVISAFLTFSVGLGLITVIDYIFNVLPD